MVTRVGILRVDGYYIVAANRAPPPGNRPAEPRIPSSISHHRRRFRGLRTHRVIEFAVGQQFGPDAGVDDVSAVLQKLSVDVFGNRSAGFGGIDRHVNWLSLS